MVLYVGEGSKREQCCLSAPSWLSVTSPATHKQIGPFWCRFPGVWVCVHPRTLWVSPTNSSVRLGASPTAATPTGFFSRRFRGSISLHWSPGLLSLSCSPVVPPSLSAHKCGTAHSTSRRCTHPSPPAAALLRVLSTLAAHLCPTYQSG